jgi:hypothetical protein
VTNRDNDFHVFKNIPSFTVEEVEAVIRGHVLEDWLYSNRRKGQLYWKITMLCVLHYDFEEGEKFTNHDIKDCVVRRNGRVLRVSNERIAAFMKFICAKDPNYEKLGRYVLGESGVAQTVYLKKGEEDEI